jgi:3-hydroxyacyl-[acyl-carrier-protein] dehydratase
MGLYGKKGTKDQSVLFMGIDKARFRGQVRPGDTLRMEVDMLQNRRGTMRFAGRIYVGDTLTCEAEMFAMVGRKGEE